MHRSVARDLVEQCASAHGWSAAQVALSYASAFEGQLTAGLIAWRHAVEDPRPILREAVEIAATGVDALDRLDAEAIWLEIDVAAAAFVSFVLDGSFDERFLAHLPPPDAWSNVPPLAFDRTLMTALVAAMREQNHLREFGEVLAKAAKNKRTALVSDVYRNYMAIIETCKGNGEASAKLVGEADRLFQQRKKNAFYSGGVQYAGGGPDNEHVVDFVLAALIVWCGGRAVPEPRTIHRRTW